MGGDGPGSHARVVCLLVRCQSISWISFREVGQQEVSRVVMKSRTARTLVKVLCQLLLQTTPSMHHQNCAASLQKARGDRRPICGELLLPGTWQHDIFCGQCRTPSDSPEDSRSSFRCRRSPKTLPLCGTPDFAETARQYLLIFWWLKNGLINWSLRTSPHLSQSQSSMMLKWCSRLVYTSQISGALSRAAGYAIRQSKTNSPFRQVQVLQCVAQCNTLCWHVQVFAQSVDLVTTEPELLLTCLFVQVLQTQPCL